MEPELSLLSPGSRPKAAMEARIRLQQETLLARFGSSECDEAELGAHMAAAAVELKEAVADSRVMAAWVLVQALRGAAAAAVGAEGAALRAAVDAFVAEHEEEVRDTDRKAEHTLHLLQEFDRRDGWQVLRETNDGSRTSYRPEEGGGTHTFKVEGVVQSDFLHLSAVLYEVDLFIQWFPMLEDAQELLLVSRWEKVVRMLCYVPWPVSNRETVARAFGVDLLEEFGRIVVHMKSVEAFPGVDIAPPKSGVVRADMKYGGFLIEVVDEKTSRLTLLINLDPKLPVIPYAILNWFSGKLLHMIVGRMGGAAAWEEGSVYAGRVRDNPAMYGDIRTRLDQYHRKQREEREEHEQKQDENEEKKKKE